MAGLQDSLLPIFIEETEAGLALIHNLVDVWEESGSVHATVLEEARRAAHTIKGTAGLVKRARSSEVAKELEEFLDSFSANHQFSNEEIDTVCRSHEQLVDLLQYACDGNPEPVSGVAATNLNDVDNADDVEQITLTQDLINDFALPFMMKLHQGSDGIDTTIKPTCCRFFLGGRQYYLAIEDVVEISESIEITFLPYGPAYLSGLINLRGDVVPVIDLSALEKRKIAFPSSYFLVIAISGNDMMAFVSDQLPNLNIKTAGHHIDVNKFLEQHSVKAL